LDIIDTASDILKILLRMISDALDIVWMPGADLWQVKNDPFPD